MSRAWRKLNRKVQIDQRRYYLWMIAVLIGIPVNFIFSGWGEDELAGTFAHFSSTWFMWVEYKTLSLYPPPPFTLYREHIRAGTHTHTHTNVNAHMLVNYCLLSCVLAGQRAWVCVRLLLVRLYVCACGFCAYLHACGCLAGLCLHLCVWDSSRAISGNESGETGECHYSDLFTF